jgi:pimeloyl-ACP methyl ester carboxylesterase
MIINNRSINIEYHGEPEHPAVLMLHHGLGSTKAWREQVPALISAGYRVIVYDRWGYGKSEPRPFLSVPDFKDDLDDLQSIVNLIQHPSIRMIGHSDGGTIALYFAAQNPSLVKALVLVAAHIYLEPKMEPGFLALKQSFEKDLRFRQGMKRVHGEKFHSTFYNWFDGWYKYHLFEWDMRKRLRDIHCPTLVIQGKGDEFATTDHAVDITKNIPSAELWIPDARHMLPQEIPVEFNRKVVDFLNKT